MINRKNSSNNSYPPPPEYWQIPCPEDEIDLADIVRVLLRQKKTIFLVTVATTLVALLFAFRQPVTYQAEIFFRPPSKADIAYFNGQFANITANEASDQVEMINNLTLSRDEFFQMFLEELRSRGLRREIFNNNYPVDEDGQSVDRQFEDFNKRVALHLPSDKKNKKAAQADSVSVTFADDSPQLAAEILNILGEKADHKVEQIAILEAKEKIDAKKRNLHKRIDILLEVKRKEIADEIARLTEADNIKRSELQRQIAIIKKQAQKKRMDRIAQLQEAAAIAHDAKIYDEFSLNQAIDINKNLADMQVSMNSLQLYMYGERVLRAEIKRLKERKDENPFIGKLRGLEEQISLLKKNEKIEALKKRKDMLPFLPEVRNIQKQLALLEGINFDQDLIHAAIVDQAAYPPEAPKATKAKMIIMLGVILGLLLGVFAAFLQNFARNMRQNEDKDQTES